MAKYFYKFFSFRSSCRSFRAASRLGFRGDLFWDLVWVPSALRTAAAAHRRSGTCVCPRRRRGLDIYIQGLSPGARCWVSLPSTECTGSKLQRDAIQDRDRFRWIFWQGIRAGTETQLGFLSEPSEDFIFAGIIEEW